MIGKECKKLALTSSQDKVFFKIFVVTFADRYFCWSLILRTVTVADRYTVQFFFINHNFGRMFCSKRSPNRIVPIIAVS